MFFVFSVVHSTFYEIVKVDELVKIPVYLRGYGAQKNN